MKVSKLLILTLALGIAACASGPNIITNYDPGTDFSKYKTFVMKKGQASSDSIAAAMIERSLAGALQARGFTRVDTGGDLNVFPHFMIGKNTQLNTTGYGGYGMRWGGGMQTTTVTEIPTGTLVVDLVDVKANNLVWRGIAKDELSTTSTPEQRQQKADAAAAKLFENFQPGSKK